MLNEAGLVEVRPLAQQRIYRLRAKPFEELDSWLETFRRIWETRLDTLDEYLQNKGRTEAWREIVFKSQGAQMTDTTGNVKKEDLVVTRIIDAPIELVWKAWTDPEHVMRWWGPKDWTSPTCKINLSEGGKYVFCMRAPKDQGGQDMYTAGVYKKIVPMERLEFTQGLSDKDGNKIDPAQVGMPPDFPEEIRTLVVFKAKGGMTELTITEYDWPVSQMFVYSLAGLHQSIDKLAESLAKA